MASMDRRLMHRGPDGAAVWTNGAIALGHRMLHTTPESLGERLPYADPASRVVITADARIDNRDELLHVFDLEPGETAAVSDSYLILNAYLRWGPACPEQLEGAFTFAIWDPREDTLFCARDRFGVRPFYYYHGGANGGGKSLFAFASEIGAILALPGIPRRLNERRVADFLVPYFEDRESTFFEGVLRLPPAHALEVRHAGPRVYRYWSFDDEHELRLGSDTEYVEAFGELFAEAVRCRLRSAFPVGSTLSGGLDSSSVTCEAVRQIQGGSDTALHTFSAVFPSWSKADPRVDERAYMDAVISSSATAGAGDRIRPHFVNVDGCRPIESALRYHDEPLPAPGLYLGDALHQAGSREGVRVLLSGQDGDTTVSHGYEYLEHLATSERWEDLRRETRALSERRGGIGATGYARRFALPALAETAARGEWRSWARQSIAVRRSLDVSLWEIGRTAAPETLRAWGRRARGRNEVPYWAALNGAIARRFANRMEIPERVKGSPASVAPSLRARHVASLTAGHWDFVLSTYDRIGAHHRVEQRYPFFDRRLAEFCVALPFRQRLGDGWTRWILRRAMDGVVPETVRTRMTKSNLGIGARMGLASELHTVERVLEDPSSIESYVDLKGFRAAYERFKRDPARASERDLFTVFLPSVLALWVEKAALSSQ
jgi:asparagine synthase (glutamine-hydrolysing)